MEYELYHFGIKGQRWGVRRYQNKDGTLTPAGKKRQYMADYRSIGTSKSLAKRDSRHYYNELKLRKKVAEATERIESGDNNPKYSNKQRAKDYETAIRGLSTLRDRQLMRQIDNARYSDINARQIHKLNNKRLTDKGRAKLEKLTTDNEIMQLNMDEAADKYAEFKSATNRLVNRMTKDSSVVYNTRRRTHAYSDEIYNQHYSISGTDYRVRANTNSRAKSKKYNDPERKKEYEDELTKTTTYYY